MIRDIRDKTVQPALLAIDSYSLAAEQLVMVTGMGESLFKSSRQIVSYHPIKYGPARGFFQMEPATHNDLCLNYINNSTRAKLFAGLRKISDKPGDPEELVRNSLYAAAMCRIHYLRIKAPLPKANDWQAMAEYWKKYYNTALGKGTVDGFLQKVRPVIELYEKGR